MAPRVTIGMPVYNGERFLDAALRSFRAQTFGDFELIISDNASTDQTAEIAQSHVSDDERLRYVRLHENAGAAYNFNHLVDIAAGEFFKWAADDDICAPEYLNRCIALLDARPEVIWCHSRMGVVDHNGTDLADQLVVTGSGMSYIQPEHLRGEIDGAPTRADCEPHRRLQAVLLETVGDGNWDVFGIIRRAAMYRTGLQRPNYGADKVFVAELALQGRYGEVDDPLFFGRLHDNASGALDTVQAQRAWIDPHGRARLTLPRLQLLGAHLQAVRSADLPMYERARCLRVVAGYAGQVPKWRRIALMALQGKGTGGGYVPFLKDNADAS